jgi:O-antigen/teichoic acid export membrane protein
VTDVLPTSDDRHDAPFHHTRRRDLALTYIANILLLALGVVSSVIVSRTLGPARRGDYAVVLLWPTIFFGTASCGLAEAFGYVALRADRALLKQQWLWLNLLTGAVVAVIGYGVIPWILIQPDVITLTRIGLLAIPMNFLITSGLAILQSCGALGAFNVSRISFSIFHLAAIALVIVCSAADVSSYLVAFLVATGSTAALTIYHVLRLPSAIPSPGLATGRELLRTVVRYGLTYHVSGILRLINDKLDLIVISMTSSMTTLGLYSVAASSASPIVAAGSAFSAIVFSEAAHRGSLLQANDTIAKRLRQATYASVALAVVGIATLPWLLPMFLGDAFEAAVPIAGVCMVAGVISGMGLVLRTGLRAVNALGIVLAAELSFSLTLPIPLAVLLPRLQGVGAALAVLGANIVSLGVMVYLIRRRGARQVGRLSLKRSDLTSILILRGARCGKGAAVYPKANPGAVERLKARLGFGGGGGFGDR